MLHRKNTPIISEIKTFFTSNEKAMMTMFNFIEGLGLSKIKIKLPDSANSKYSHLQKLMLLLIFPFFEVNDPSHYKNSALFKILGCGKDVFYRFLNNPNIDWRKISYSINKRLIGKVGKHTNIHSDSKPKCLIFDDSDIVKTGRHIENIGRIYSHVTHKSTLGFKALFMGLFDGKSFLSLDFSLHGEKGKNKKKPYGFTPKQLRERFKKKRDKNSCGKQREDEYFTTKIESVIAMTRRTISEGVRFDYLLVDSWFTCYKLVKFIKTRRINCHFLGMIKMGKTKYLFEDKQLTAKELIQKCKQRKKMKHSRSLGLYYIEATVMFQDIPVKIFFSKAGKRGKWKAIMTTRTTLGFLEAYQIYSYRWTIEVFFRDVKQHLGMAKCQSRDFDAQIAWLTLRMLQYNILSVVRRFEAYETLGELFRETRKDHLKIPLGERILLIIIEISKELAPLLEIDPEELMEKYLSENEKIKNYINFESLIHAA